MQRKLESFGVQFHKIKLRNGSYLFHFERRGMPLYIRAAFFAGSRFDSIPGTAHFLEHLLVAGTERFPSKNLIAEHIQKTGGDFGASTNNSILRFNVEIPETEDIDVGLEVMSECLTKSSFKDSVIETERGAVLSELKSNKNNPNKRVSEATSRLVFQGTPLASSVMGDEESIRKITKNDLIGFCNKFIHSGRVSFISSGDIKANTLADKINSLDLGQYERFAMSERLPVIREKKLEIDYDNKIDHLEVALATRTDTKNYKEWCALRVLNNIMSVGRGSRLITKLRYQKGLVYTISSYVSSSVDWETITIRFSCDKKKFDEVRSVIFEEFENLKTKGVMPTELEGAKSRLSKGSKRFFQTSDAWVDFHQDAALFSPTDVHTVEDYITTINDLNLEDLRAVAQKYLVKENFLAAVYGDYKE